MSKKLLDYAGLQKFLNRIKGLIPTKTSELQNDSGYITAQGTYDDELSLVSEQAVQNKVVTAAINSKQNSLSSGQLDAANSGVTSAKVQGYDSHISDTDIHVTAADKTNWDSKAAGTHTHIASDVSGLSTVATSGSYNDLSNKPSIPSKTSDLTNDSGFLTSHNPVDSALSSTSTNAVQNKVVKAELDNKANSADLSTVATTGSYTDLNNIPSNFTPASHTHGSITNDGKLGTASRALITDGNKKIAVSSVTSTELGYLSGVTSAVQDQLDGKAASTHSHTASEVSGLATVATSGSYNDLTNKPTIPTVNNATLTIQKNGTTVKTFTANASANVTADITVPTKVSELTNDSGFLTAHNPVDSALSSTSTNAVQNKIVKGALDGKSDTGHTHTKSEITDFPALATVATSGSYNDLTNKPTIPTVNNATLTIQKNGTTVKTFTANASSNVTANITVPTKVSELTNDSGYLTSASSLDSSKLTGTIDIARLPKGALERLVTVANQTARFALTTSDVQLGDTVKQLDTGVMYIVSDESKLSSADGYTEYTAGAATSVPWSGVTDKPSSYTPASHSHGNIANGGTLGTASRALITDGNKKITTSSVTSTELGYLSGVTSAIQTQLNGKAASSHTHTASEVSGLSTVATSGSYNDLSNKPTIDSALSSTSTNAVQNKVINTALSGKAASSHTHTKSQITDFPTKTSQFTNDSHQTITVGTDTTSTASPAHSGTFTCIDSVTRDSNGHVTAVNTKTVTLPADNNTDTLVTQNVSTANENHPILLTVTKDATANQGAKTSIFASGVKVNPSTNTVTATTFSGALSGNASSATQFSANKDVTLTGDVTGTASSKAGWSVATTLSDSGVTAGTYGPSADVTGNNNATISVPEITVDAKGRVTSVTNRTLTCKNNTYSVYNKTLTIQKNGTNVATFTSNSNTDVTANITVPTKVSELTNDSGFLTEHQDLSLYPYKVASYSNHGNGRWPYIDLGDTTTHPNGFNEIVTTGKYHVRWTYETTVGVPFTTSAGTDGILEVDGISSASGVSSYQRVVQRVYRQSSSYKVYFRFGTYYNGIWNWADWTSYGDIVTHNADEFLTGTVAIANGGTGATTRLDAVKNLTSENVGTETNYFLTITTNWGKAGYCSVAHAKTVLGLGSAAYTASTAYAAASHTHTKSQITDFPTKVSAFTNDAGYLTSHQSLSNYVTLNGTQTISGIKTLSSNLLFSSTNTRGTAPSAKEERDFAEFKDSAGNKFSLFGTSYYTDKTSKTSILAYNTTVATGSSIGAISIGCDTSGNVYTEAPTPATSDNSTKIATTAFVKAQGYLTSHQSLSNYSTLANTIKSLSISGKTITYTKGDNTTGTLTTQDTNTDTKVTQTVTTTNSDYPIILSDTADKTATSTEGARFTTALYANARYGYLYQKNTYNSACVIGTAPTADTVVARIYQKDHSGDDAAQIYTQINKTTGHVRSYWRVYNKLTDGALDPDGTATSTYLDLTMGTAGKAIATDALWDSNLTPLANNSKTLGTSSLKWKAAYAVNFYENGTALSSKYLTVSAISGGASTSAGNITPVTGTIILGFAESDVVSYSTNFGGVLTNASHLFCAFCVYNTSTLTMEFSKGPAVGGTGTWKLMGGVTNPGVSTKLLFGLWIKIA